MTTISTATATKEATLEGVNQVVEAILETLGTPECDLHRQALAAFKSGDHLAVKRLSSTNLDDHYCRSLGYLGSASKLLPTTDTILSEAARAAADFVRKKAVDRLSAEIDKALN